MHPSPYSQYVKERHGWSVIERDDSFIAYSIEGDYARIEELFVPCEQRNLKIGSLLADEVAQIGREHGCSFLWSNVSLRTRNANDSIRAILAYGFTAVQADKDIIYFLKEIKKEGA